MVGLDLAPETISLKHRDHVMLRIELDLDHGIELRFLPAGHGNRGIGYDAAAHESGLRDGHERRNVDVAPVVAERLHVHPASAPKDMMSSITGMSQSRFAQRFRTLCGSAPIEYLTQWRMMLARDCLLGVDDSDTAFSTAFQRRVGKAPRTYVRECRRSASS